MRIETVIVALAPVLRVHDIATMLIPAARLEAKSAGIAASKELELKSSSERDEGAVMPRVSVKALIKVLAVAAEATMKKARDRSDSNNHQLSGNNDYDAESESDVINAFASTLPALVCVLSAPAALVRKEAITALAAVEACIPRERFAPVLSMLSATHRKLLEVYQSKLRNEMPAQ